MIDPRERLENELLKIGLDKKSSTLISLDAGSSQCVVNREYLDELEINSKIINEVHQKVIAFYSGHLV
jgi:hypothetical protein